MTLNASTRADRRRDRAPRGFTLLELMIIVVFIALVSATAYPRITDTLRKSRAREAAKRVVNAVLVGKSEAMIRNQSVRITVTTASDTGADNAVSGGGSVQMDRMTGASCTGAATLLDRFEMAGLKDVNLCLSRTNPAGLVDATTGCQPSVTLLCALPDGTVVNLATPAAANTLIYVREYERQSGSPVPVGVVRQIVIPRRKTVQLLPIQVTDNACL